jgi:hypothetical protein
MEVSPILNADGLPVMTFGGLRSLKTRSIRGYTVSFEWCRDPDNRKRVEPCMVIWNDRVNRADAGAWIITRRGIMKFCDQHNRPTQHAFVEARESLPVLGMDTTDLEMRRLVDVVMDAVDDLVQMPLVPLEVRQRLKRQSVWEITRRDQNRRTIDQAEV